MPAFLAQLLLQGAELARPGAELVDKLLTLEAQVVVLVQLVAH
jgi:hypothetical protein